MQKIGYKMSNKDEQENELSSLDSMNNQKDKFKMSGVKKEIAKIILEYSDSKLYPLRQGEERDKWFLEQMRKIRIRYLEDI